MMDGKMTIFYTDDDEDDLEFFKKVIRLIDESYSVITHLDGTQLLDALDNPPPCPSVLFLDINMPGFNGIELLEIIRKSEKYAQLPIIMLSTTNDVLVIRKAHELGANYYVPKPSSFTELRKSIEHTLKINWQDFMPEFNNFVYIDK
tara:strand:+ start:269936 stop:270376 length:441 start_codon:yes stop_codon:yes gene_type:complete